MLQLDEWITVSSGSCGSGQVCHLDTPGWVLLVSSKCWMCGLEQVRSCLNQSWYFQVNQFMPVNPWQNALWWKQHFSSWSQSPRWDTSRSRLESNIFYFQIINSLFILSFKEEERKFFGSNLHPFKAFFLTFIFLISISFQN